MSTEGSGASRAGGDGFHNEDAFVVEQGLGLYVVCDGASGTPAGEIAARCEAAGLPFAPVNRPEALFDDPHLNAGGLVDVPLPDGRTTKLPGLAIELDGKRLGRRNDPPAPGAGARDWLRTAGLAEDEIDALQARGVIVAGG